MPSKTVKIREETLEKLESVEGKYTSDKIDHLLKTKTACPVDYDKISEIIENKLIELKEVRR